jgi:hypothetical protein
MKKWPIYMLMVILFIQKDNLLLTLHFSQRIIQFQQQHCVHNQDYSIIEISDDQWKEIQLDEHEVIWNHVLHEVVHTEMQENGMVRLTLHPDLWETKVAQLIRNISESTEQQIPVVGIEFMKWWLEKILITSPPNKATDLPLRCSNSSLSTHYCSPTFGIKAPPPKC